MVQYHELDAYKVCHELALRVHRIVDEIGKRDAELAGQLWLAALIAPSRIARGAGMASVCGRKPFIACLDRTLGALNEMAYHLNLALAMGLLASDTHRELDGLRGRASFYTMKLMTSLLEPPGSAKPP